MNYLIISLIVFAQFFNSLNAQDIHYAKQAYDKTGAAGTSVSPELDLVNTGDDTIEVFVNRIFQNLPENWNSCFCFDICHPPTLDTLRFRLAPGEETIIGVAFNTDTIPGIGYVHLTVEQVNGNQKDTLKFSGSTLVSGVHNNSGKNGIKCYPNPANSAITFDNSFGEDVSVELYDYAGTLLYTERLSNNPYFLDISALPSGNYFLKAVLTSGDVYYQKIIKLN